MDAVTGWHDWKTAEGLDISVLNDPGHLEYVMNVLRILEAADYFDGLMWRVRDGKATFALLCSDTFWWASADCEEIRPEDLPLLWQCWQDLKAIQDADRLSLALCDLPELYAARKRGMRPMRAWLGMQDGTRREGKVKPEWEPVKALFLAAGPERDPKEEG